MSREQWGHGYWQGVVDEKYGKVKGCHDVEKTTKLALYNMARWNLDAYKDRSLYSVSSLISFFRFAGTDNPESIVKPIYDFVLNYHPLDCWITGGPKDPWYEDYFEIASLLRYSRQELTNKIDELYKEEEIA